MSVPDSAISRNANFPLALRLSDNSYNNRGTEENLRLKIRYADPKGRLIAPYKGTKLVFFPQSVYSVVGTIVAGWRFSVKQIALGKVHCYYLQNEKGTVLIDTGYFHDKTRFRSLLAKEGIDIGDICFLLLTHHHDDHCGLVSYLLEQNPKIRLIMHSLCSKLVLKGCNSTEDGGKWCSRRMKAVMTLYEKFKGESSSTYPPFEVREDDILLDFSHGPVSFLGYTIIPTPGHTPDSIGLLDDRGNFFCGDAAANFLHFAGTKYAPPIIANLQEFYDTWEKLLALPIQRIYPGHGKSFSPHRLKANLYCLKEENLKALNKR